MRYHGKLVDGKFVYFDKRGKRVSERKWKAGCKGLHTFADARASGEGKRITPGAAYPYWSDSLGVAPEQIPQFMEADRKAGFATEYNPVTGQLKITDRGFRKRYCQHLGFYDRNGGYGDPQKR